MHFTREPIIESIVTSKEGCKLVVRNSKNPAQEDYFVDFVEIVSFGHAIFYRSLEKPKSFLLPITDYEVIEVKETKMVLKNVSMEKSIKIGGGKEEKKSRKTKKRKPEKSKEVKGGGDQDETQVSSSIIKRLIPPPTTLIKEKLSQVKSTELVEENILPDEVVLEEKKSETVVEPEAAVKKEKDAKEDKKS